MSRDVRTPFRNGDNVYLQLPGEGGIKEYYEAIVLDHSYDDNTLAAHMRGPDGRPTWVVHPHIHCKSLGSVRRDPAPRIHNIVRGTSCLYWTWEKKGRWTAVNAVVLDHRLFQGSCGDIRSVLDIAFRSESRQAVAGWEIATDVARALVNLGFSGGAERLVIE